MSKMKITLHHPPVSKLINPLEDLHPWNEVHYPPKDEQGIYIYGIRTQVDGIIKFVPIVVGESGNLRERLYNQHYLGKFATPLNRLFGDLIKAPGDPKEIWDFYKNDFKLAEIKEIYKDASLYDKKLPKGTSKVKHVAKLDKLIFFQDETFFYLKHGMSPPKAISNIKIEESVPYLFSLVAQTPHIPITQLNSINQHISRIINTLVNFKSNFYYVYASTNNNSEDVNKILSDEPTRKKLEYEIKKKLKLIGIHTTAKASKIKKSSQFNIDVSKINIDLSRVQDELVNVGSNGYNDIVTGNFKRPLIL
jgi:hypothetical protein